MSVMPPARMCALHGGAQRTTFVGISWLCGVLAE
jgi:hypothetical protein